jgi:hypothetical protein
LDLAVHRPALDGKIELFFPDLDDMGHPISPFTSRHPAPIGIFAELAVGIGADQAVLYFHAGYLKRFYCRLNMFIIA